MKVPLQLCSCILFLFGLVFTGRSEESAEEAKHLIRVDRKMSTAGGILHFVVEGKTAVLLNEKDLQVFWFKPLESIHEVVMSEDRSTVLIRVMESTSGNRRIRAFNYSRLVLLKTDKKGNWEQKVYLPKNRLPMEERGRWIAGLRSVENDGRSAVVRFGEDSEEDPRRTVYDWRTIDLESGNTLKDVAEPRRDATTEVKAP